MITVEFYVLFVLSRIELCKTQLNSQTPYVTTEGAHLHTHYSVQWINTVDRCTEEPHSIKASLDMLVITVGVIYTTCWSMASEFVIVISYWYQVRINTKLELPSENEVLAS